MTESLVSCSVRSARWIMLAGASGNVPLDRAGAGAKEGADGGEPEDDPDEWLNGFAGAERVERRIGRDGHGEIQRPGECVPEHGRAPGERRQEIHEDAERAEQHEATERADAQDEGNEDRQGAALGPQERYPNRHEYGHGRQGADQERVAAHAEAMGGASGTGHSQRKRARRVMAVRRQSPAAADL